MSKVAQTSTQSASRAGEARSHQDWVRRRITVHGIVQGVGFRPFVNRLARRHSLAGGVHNFTGGVRIEVEGPLNQVNRFIQSLTTEAPPIAVLDRVQVEEIDPTGRSGFVIAPSTEEPGGPILVSPDVAMCADCAAELTDPTNRRFRHPFINCTNCGPRFTIIRQVPYDRPFTSMAAFPMCPACEREYHDLDDRRYHAQPVACPQCGPRVWLVGGEDATARGDQSHPYGDQALRTAQRLLAQGMTVAIKGVGGVHLACNARDDAAVRRLRERKRREQKPFAVMVASVDVARNVAQVSAEAERLLTSPQAPIVLVPKRHPEALAPAVAPDSRDYGLLLPYTPLHRLLFDAADYDALVMTSGNLSGEPLCTDNEEALQRLGGIADAFLLHDRDILVGCDDSVVRTSPRGPILIRRARGYVPFPVRMGWAAAEVGHPGPEPPASGEVPSLVLRPHRVATARASVVRNSAKDRRALAQGTSGRSVLAVGGQLKNTFCITSGDNAFLSQHMGDLDDLKSLEFFERCVAHLQSILQVRPQAVACDLHPDYLSTRYAEELAREHRLPLIRVQHHHAHIASCLADNGQNGPVVGLACDGTGLGDDGTVWGCEVLVCDRAQYTRVGHLRPVPLAGGDLAVRQPWRAALGYLMACGLAAEAQWLRERLAERVDEQELQVVQTMLERGVNCPPASSAGRLFDAVAAILGFHLTVAYEGQAAMALEATARPTPKRYPFTTTKIAGMVVMDPGPLLAAIVEDVALGVDQGEVAGAFHNTVVEMLAQAAAQAAEEHRLSCVALSGGTFQNRLLLEGLCRRLEDQGLVPLWQRAVPPNDGGLALGQAVVASANLSG